MWAQGLSTDAGRSLDAEPGGKFRGVKSRVRSSEACEETEWVWVKGMWVGAGGGPEEEIRQGEEEKKDRSRYLMAACMIIRELSYRSDIWGFVVCRGW